MKIESTSPCHFLFLGCNFIRKTPNRRGEKMVPNIVNSIRTTMRPKQHVAAAKSAVAAAVTTPLQEMKIEDGTIQQQQQLRGRNVIPIENRRQPKGNGCLNGDHHQQGSPFRPYSQKLGCKNNTEDVGDGIVIKSTTTKKITAGMAAKGVISAESSVVEMHPPFPKKLSSTDLETACTSIASAGSADSDSISSKSELETKAKSSSILKIPTQAESLARTYEGSSNKSSSSAASRHGKKLLRKKASTGDEENLSVSFSNAYIHHHNYTLGDSPAVSWGPSVSIGWISECSSCLPLDFYENLKQQKEMQDRAECQRQNIRQKKGLSRFKLSHVERERLLKEHGYSRKDIIEASRVIRLDQERRDESLAEQLRLAQEQGLLPKTLPNGVSPYTYLRKNRKHLTALVD